MAIKVPDTNTFSLVDVYNAVNDHANPTGDLADCFSKAISSYFDPAYNTDSYAPANSMKRFRNYGHYETSIIYGSPGTTNHWLANSFLEGNTALDWDEAVYDDYNEQTDDILYGTDLGIGYAGHHNDHISQPETTIWRSFLEFDTSFLGSSANVISATLRLYAAVHEHNLNPSIAPVNIKVVSSNDSYIPLGSDFFSDYPWRNVARNPSRGSFAVDSYSYKYYDIQLDPSAIALMQSTWLIPRLNYWDYGYTTDNGFPTYLRAVKFYINKTGTYAPRLTIEYSN